MGILQSGEAIAAESVRRWESLALDHWDDRRLQPALASLSRADADASMEALHTPTQGLRRHIFDFRSKSRLAKVDEVTTALLGLMKGLGLGVQR